MISDEMRELLSAYVDGELRDADAARVEDVSKRDPELRHEIEAYRTLRRKLREWDAAENGFGPASTLASRVLAKARTMDAALASRARTGLRGPLALAAALLLSVAAGYLVARSTAPGTPSHPAPGTPIAVQPIDPLPDVALEGSALVPASPPAAVVQRMRIDDHIPSRRALELEEILRHDEVVKATPPEPRPERFTGTPVSTEIKAMVGGYTPSAQPSGALVLIARPPALRAFEPVEPASGRARDPSEGQIMSKLVGNGASVISPLGELWVGADRRARIISESYWVRRNSDALLSVVWADDIATSKTTPDVEVQELILGPRARQRLLAAKPGLDLAFLAWLREAYGERPLPALAAEEAKDRERAVNKLVDALARDAGATGFAVFDAEGKLLGTELFDDHALMLAFAPRLLRGYLLEAGEDGIRFAPPGQAGAGPDAVRNLLDGMPSRALRVERQRLDVPYDSRDPMKAAPDGVARVTFRTAAGHPVGHGLVRDETPIHLTLFPE